MQYTSLRVSSHSGVAEGLNFKGRYAVLIGKEAATFLRIAAPSCPESDIPESGMIGHENQGTTIL
jgi:hypothetical protein